MKSYSIKFPRMKTVFSLVLTLVFCFSHAQSEINRLDNKGQKHGLWKGYYPESNRVKYEGVFEHGKETGIFTFYDDTKAATVIATRDFSKGNNSAYTKFFDQQKNVVSEGNVVKKQYDGLWKFYHKNSKQLMSTETYKNGKLDGKRTVFYPDGKIAEEAMYKNGIRSGPYKRYAISGTVLEEVTYKDDQPEGPAVYREGNGNIASKGNYVGGQKKGYWEFYEGGKLKVREKYPLQRKKTDTTKERK